MKRGFFNDIQFRLWAFTEGLPAELRDAKLVGSELTIAADKPVPLRGQLDQLFRRPDGLHMALPSGRNERGLSMCCPCATHA